MWKKRIKAGFGAAIRFTDPIHRKFGPPRLLVLMYHRVLPFRETRHPTIQPGMVVTAETFERQLRWIRSSYTILPLSEWLDRAINGASLPRRACAITFDDGWFDNFRYAFPILRKNGVPATIFVTSSRIGTKKWFWPERLARLLWSGIDVPALQLPSALQRDSEFSNAKKQLFTNFGIDKAIGHAKAWPDAELEEILDVAEQSCGWGSPGERRLLTWSELKEMVDSNLIEVGSHTANHIRLRFQLGEEILKREIVDSRMEIADRLSTPPPNLFCYPNGDLSSHAEQLVRSHYSGACTTLKGLNTRRTDFHHLLRVGIHESVAGSEALFRFHTACLH